MKLGILLFVIFFSWSGLACASGKGHFPKPKPLELKDSSSVEYKPGSSSSTSSNNQSKKENARDETNESSSGRSPNINYSPIHINYKRPRI